jgi:hypothetical protein
VGAPEPVRHPGGPLPDRAADARARLAGRELGQEGPRHHPRPGRGPRGGPVNRQFRARQANPLSGKTIHHSDAGSRYTSIKFGESIMLAGMIGSIGSVGDAFDQRPGRDDDRAVQDRVHPGRLPVPHRPADPPGRRRGHHRGLGVLVQQPPARAPRRTTPTSRVRSRLLCQHHRQGTRL